MTPRPLTLADPIDAVVSDDDVRTALTTGFGIRTVEDLLRHYPQRYAAQGRDLGEQQPDEGAHITVVATVRSAKPVKMRNRPGSLLRVVLDAGGRSVDATFFQAHRVSHVIRPGVRGMFSGTAKWFRGQWGLTHPSYLILPAGEKKDGHAGALADVHGAGALAGLARAAGGDSEFFETIMALPHLPIYRAGKGIESWTILRYVLLALARLRHVDDPVPDSIRDGENLIGLDEALRLVHVPDSQRDITLAHHRLRFDEALALQLVLARRRHDNDDRAAPPCPPVSGGLAAEFDDRLPFELTAGQREVAGEIASDLSRAHPMSRLLQGEVGSGKTIVALRAMLQVIDAGHQCALLAPTEVLATQHARSMRAMLGPLGIAGELGAAGHATRVTLLTGSMSTAARRQALLDAVTGEAGIVVGTHALIQEGVEFFDLGMVVVDEQHRFGVEQRDALRSRAREGLSPHLLVMTATPIPRTIAMTLLGDLEVSTLRELPRGRSPIQSSVVPASTKPAWVARAWQRVREEVGAGRQAYVVCSRIGDDEPPARGKGSGAKRGASKEKDEKENPTVAAVDLYRTLSGDVLSDLRVGLLHGRLPADEKDAVMAEFTAGDIDVLVCTTVIEVGVDVPNATVMVIVDADRFGVSQLHQLRGRVGRGAHAGLCILVTETGPGSPTFTRLSDVAATNDGFALAQLDLEARREGDILGAAQSGVGGTLRLLSLIEHEDVIATAARYATEVVAEDPALTAHEGLARMVDAALDGSRIDYLEKT
ncbi:ATP-dependent DNA helicase RecG [Rhodococcus rhodnii]|uniref:DNA helicase n=2 Tax=Rhodococcus rhodnii TaxID=38312 RepID=R7WIP1_9NOCA|nr:ATP-dependent DNA helicase RecG [Rhodococcus rhodnii]EOM75068.1 DNA helicase [Rhodococcus rhodnii LMG 5362]TXG90804.1 ATP-dependent DNA helicase RecG [Rhodococcus rhodnii]